MVTIYKVFIRLHLDYEDILYKQIFNNSFHEKLELVQYNAALAITATIKGSSREKLHQELGFESLQQQRWYRELCLFFKIIKKQSPRYLLQLIPTARQAYMTREKNSIPLFNVSHNYFRNFFFPSTIVDWSNLDSNIRSILSFTRSSTNSTFLCQCPDSLKLIASLGLSHLRFHKFKHNFQDTLNPV